MFNNPYGTNNYSTQYKIDQINNQIAELEKLRQQIPQQQIQPQPTNLTQNFQLAPTNRDGMKYANSIEDVQKEMVVVDTPYFSKDMSVVWIKTAKGEIKPYELTEVELKDEKDMKIDFLIAQIEELKKEMRHNEPDAIIDGTITEPVESKKSTSVSTISKSEKKSK